MQSTKLCQFEKLFNRKKIYFDKNKRFIHFDSETIYQLTFHKAIKKKIIYNNVISLKLDFLDFLANC